MKVKEFKKFLKELSKDSRFSIEKASKKTTIKVVHLETGQMYSVHPADQAVQPLKNWIRKL